MKSLRRWNVDFNRAKFLVEVSIRYRSKHEQDHYESLNVNSRPKFYIIDESVINFSIQDSQWREWRKYYFDNMAVLSQYEVKRRYRQEHNDWIWRNLWKELRAIYGNMVKCYCLVSDGLVHGMMIVGPAMPTNFDNKTSELLYVHYLATAPWNEHRLYINHKALTEHFKDDDIKPISGAGWILIRQAIVLSKELGFEGRIGLHALEDAVDFYLRRCCMNFLGQKIHREQQDENYPWCELSNSGVRFLLDEE